MKLPLSKPRARYHVWQDDVTRVEDLSTQPHSFLVWTRVGGARHDSVVLLRRVKTHEIPGSKWVEYRAEPDGFLADGRPYALTSDLLDAVVGSDWASYLRLVRRKKGAEATERDGHLALLTRCRLGGGYQLDQVWALKALDVGTG